MHTFHAIEYIALAVMILLLLLVLFEPPLRYKVKAPDAPLDSEDFLRLLAALADAPLYRDINVEPLIDGKSFYEAELAAIAQATKSVHLEAFIFHPSAVGDRFLQALVERAKNGVKVRVVLDAIGSFPAPKRYFNPLREAGGEVRWYQPLRFGTLKRMNNRTHRELIIIDGRIGFIGGAGIANHWHIGEKGKPPWRDMMFRVRGALVNSLQSTFAENWLESSNEILSDIDAFPSLVSDITMRTGAPAAATAGLVITSSPTSGRSTRNRILFQLLIASARRTIRIHSPYFLPDRSASEELCRAVQERQVNVQVVVPGESNNHHSTRLASRRRYGPLLKVGVEIHEYQPGMIHTKVMTVDDMWVVVGSTNFDSRSFDLNDEVNLAVIDQTLAAQLQQEFTAAINQSERITYERWQRRSVAERLAAAVGRLWERQE
jgi:cardiolipin synthase